MLKRTQSILKVVAKPSSTPSMETWEPTSVEMRPPLNRMLTSVAPCDNNARESESMGTPTRMSSSLALDADNNVGKEELSHDDGWDKDEIPLTQTPRFIHKSDKDMHVDQDKASFPDRGKSGKPESTGVSSENHYKKRRQNESLSSGGEDNDHVAKKAKIVESSKSVEVTLSPGRCLLHVQSPHSDTCERTTIDTQVSTSSSHLSSVDITNVDKTEEHFKVVASNSQEY
jgi:hypothetical protein